jgi:hypothetical protein
VVEEEIKPEDGAISERITYEQGENMLEMLQIRYGTRAHFDRLCICMSLQLCVSSRTAANDAHLYVLKPSPTAHHLHT